MIRRSTLQVFAENIVDQLEEVAQKLQTVEEIISGNSEPDAEDTAAEAVEDEEAEEDVEDVPPVSVPVETEDDEDDTDTDVAEDYANDETGTEEVPPPVEEETETESDSGELYAASYNPRKPVKKTDKKNFAETRYAKVKDFLSGKL